MPAARVTASLMLGCLSRSMVVTRGAPGLARLGVAATVEDRLHRPAEPVLGVGHPRLAFVHA